MAAHVPSYPTPDVSHLSAADYQDVYEPAEDSFLLLDSLEKDINVIKRRKPLLCLEVGSGSGVVVTFLASLLGNGLFYLASDINGAACRASMQTLKRGGILTADCLQDDLLQSCRQRLKNSIDLLVFNPPYVPTTSEEVQRDGISSSWAGGERGREVIDRFLPLVDKLLSPSGLFYLLLLDKNRPTEVCETLQHCGLKSKLVLSRRAGSEKLVVYCFSQTL